jgi:Flp pilus assembly pilin Flp
MASLIRRLVDGEDAATMLEYAIMLSLIGAALVTAVTGLASAMGVKFTSVSNTLSGS